TSKLTDPLSVNLIALDSKFKITCLNFDASPLTMMDWSGDASKFKQVILNLLSNAIKFTESGSVNLDVMVDFDHSESNPLPLAKIRCKVKDTGIGIAPESLDKVMQPFSQADNSVQRKFGGTGLGLSISKQLCKLMQGDLDIESDGLGSGTCVTCWVYMPCLIFEGTSTAAPVVSR
ncbi:MAG: ATP-binding protein, partial [Chloroflexota bacterium]